MQLDNLSIKEKKTESLDSQANVSKYIKIKINFFFFFFKYF